MLGDILLYIGAAIITVWGIAHIVPTKNVVNGFGAISQDNKRIITMEWIAAGLAQIFIGLLVFLVTVIAGSGAESSKVVYWASAAVLVALAVLGAFTGARTPILPMKLCPIIEGVVAVLLLLGIFVSGL
ncbi:MAG: hypothetical protein FJ008_06470 [Chloroflexi bacterium]|nr:hypothetical protein [Chloroflexota bacterium]MBM3166350.1 hypothetical protein [Chloroflexota bacterium]MBM3172797.1 hypothetical protein [Chloroflexota bacterium]MBM4451979.1 hypothetical protein [Chloroflexota bacterium]